ncbi:MAG: hypothetical protein WBW47_05090 [Thermoplasmata archaeon]|jgi:ABC-type amino acid transport system permease subunit
MTARLDPPFSPGPDEAGRFFRGVKARIAATIALLVGGLCWVILYLAFLAGRFAWYQNLAIVLVSFIVVPVIVVVMWIFWGLSVGRRFHRAFWDDEFP